jgi:hypothetical protein
MKKILLVGLTICIALWGQTAGTNWSQIKASDRHGTGAKGQSSDGTGTSGNVPTFNASGGLTDGPAPSITVNGTTCTLGSTCAPAGAGGITALTGDVAASGGGSAAATVAKVNGIAYSATAAAHTVQVTTTANATVTAKVIPDCTDTAGNHLNFTQSTDSFSCGTSGSSSATVTVASGTSALGTSAIGSGACASAVTTAATGTATTDNVMADFNGDPTAVTGYAPVTTGMLTIIKYPTANNVNFKVCNLTGASITPGAITLNWRVVR